MHYNLLPHECGATPPKPARAGNLSAHGACADKFPPGTLREGAQRVKEGADYSKQQSKRIPPSLLFRILHGKLDTGAAYGTVSPYPRHHCVSLCARVWCGPTRRARRCAFVCPPLPSDVRGASSVPPSPPSPSLLTGSPPVSFVGLGLRGGKFVHRASAHANMRGRRLCSQTL